MSDDLVAFLLARIAEDEQLARMACIKGHPEHWQWVATETDEPVLDADLDKVIEEQNLSLRSVEEYQTSYVGGGASTFRYS